MTIPAGARLGAYEVLAPLGAGGMGEVYRAKDSRLGREVALKVLPPSVASDRDRLSRFEQEARSASALNHPNIVTIHEIGREGDTAYIAMELVDGRTLRELTVSGPMPVRKILGIAAQIAEGLAKAHGAGIVHRDLKPENVMISKDGFVKILDFGLAKLTDPEPGEASAMPTLAQPETRPGTVMGTVGYMSPEQASGERLDFRSDQFALGSMLYEMATGQKAFGRKTAAETMSAIIRDEPEPVSKLRPDFPVAVRWILDRCLAKDPEERYASTRDLARDLAGLRDHISEASSGAEALFASPQLVRRRALPWVAGLALVAASVAIGWAVAGRAARKPATPPSFKRLTFRQGELANARFASDGQTILYGARWQGEPRQTRLFMTRLESPDSRAFDFPSADILSISRAGELAILIGDDPQGGILARVSIAGGVPRQLLENVPYASADWAPDGKDLVVVRAGEAKSRLEYPIGKVILEAAGILTPRFSPDGKSIAFSEVGERRSVSVIDRDGRNRKQLSGGWASFQGVPCWSSDGEEVWFTAARRGERDAVWAVDRSGRLRLVTRVPGSLELDDISRDGRALMAHHTILNYVTGSLGESQERDLAWLDQSAPSDLSSDGKTLLLTERGEGSGATPTVYLRGTDGSPAVRLAEGMGLALSPDQKTALVLTPASEGKPPFLSLLPTGPGDGRVLKNGGLSRFVWAAFLPGGQKIVFAAEAPGRPVRLYTQQVPDGDPQPASPEGVSIGRFTSPVSPDGRWVVGRRNGEHALYSLNGGDPRVLSGLQENDSIVQWTADGRSLYVLRRGTPARVFLVDVEGGKTRLWREIPHEGSLQIVRATPDGRVVVYAGTRVFAELYLVEGLR